MYAPVAGGGDGIPTGMTGLLSVPENHARSLLLLMEQPEAAAEHAMVVGTVRGRGGQGIGIGVGHRDLSVGRSSDCTGGRRPRTPKAPSVAGGAFVELSAR